MTKKVIIDCDMGTDDAVALCIALFHENLDILAVTATEGTVTAEQATRNLQAIIGMLDPPRHPRLGAASPSDDAPPINTTFLYGEDGLGNSGFEVSTLQRMMPADKLINDCIRSHPGDVTIICLGPLTNVAKAFRRDPSLVEQVDRLIITGGSTSAQGNITAAAEFNCFFDPPSAHAVFNSRTTKTLIPLEVTTRVRFNLDFLDGLPERYSKVGDFLRQILPHAYRMYRNRLGQEDIFLNDVVGLVSVLHPELFEFEAMAGQVEMTGELTRGVMVFDRRAVPEWSVNMEVATAIHDTEVRAIITQLLNEAAHSDQG